LAGKQKDEDNKTWRRGFKRVSCIEEGNKGALRSAAGEKKKKERAVYILTYGEGGGGIVLLSYVSSESVRIGARCRNRLEVFEEKKG